MAEQGPDPAIELVLRYIETVQRARGSQRADDFDAVRRLLSPNVVIKLASRWTDEPWRVTHTGADAVVERLQAPINAATSLATENVNVQRAGDDVVVEQLSTITDAQGEHVSMVCHIFSVTDRVITGVRAYRNDVGLPAG
jgi:ketosteroid isomerase-like protein